MRVKLIINNTNQPVIGKRVWYDDLDGYECELENAINKHGSYALTKEYLSKPEVIEGKIMAGLDEDAIVYVLTDKFERI